MKALYISVTFISSRVLLSDTISLLICCLEDLSIFDSGLLKSPTMILLLSISFLKSSKIFFMYLGAPMLGAYIFTMIVFLVDSSFEYDEVTFWMSPYGPFLKSILSDMSIATPAFFFFFVHLLGKFVPSPSLSVCVGLLS